jgi:hypothetical protein
MFALTQPAAAWCAGGFVDFRPPGSCQLEPVRMLNIHTIVKYPVGTAGNFPHHAGLKHSEALLLSPLFVSFCFHRLFPLR